MELNGKLYHDVIPLIHDTFGQEKEHQFPQRDFGEQKVVFFLSASYPFYESLLAGTKKAVFEKQHRSPLPSYDHPVLSFLNFNPGFFFFSSKAFSRIIFSIFLIAPK